MICTLREAFDLDRRIIFDFHLTDACDQRCKYCHMQMVDYERTVTELPVLDFQELLFGIIRCCEHLGKEPVLTFSGGDPLLHPDLWRILLMVKVHEFRFNIHGTPYRLTPEICRRLRDYGCERFQITLDGLQATHDRLRRPGSFAVTLDRIAMIQEAGLLCAVHTRVSPDNVNELPELIALAAELGVDEYSFARSRRKNQDDGVCLSAQHYRSVLDACWKQMTACAGSRTKFILEEHLWTLYRYEEGLWQPPADPDAMDGCLCGRNYLHILPDGSVLACNKFDSLVGVRPNNRFLEIFKGEAMAAYRQYDKFEKCAGCELLRFCRGCPAIAHSFTGRFYSRDPQCWRA